LCNCVMNSLIVCFMTSRSPLMYLSLVSSPSNLSLSLVYHIGLYCLHFLAAASSFYITSNLDLSGVQAVQHPHRMSSYENEQFSVVQVQLERIDNEAASIEIIGARATSTIPASGSFALRHRERTA
jgi:hypothetical protein